MGESAAWDWRVGAVFQDVVPGSSGAERKRSLIGYLGSCLSNLSGRWHCPVTTITPLRCNAAEPVQRSCQLEGRRRLCAARCPWHGDVFMHGQCARRNIRVEHGARE